MEQINLAQAQKMLQNVRFPVDKQNLIKQAEQLGANEQIRETLQQLPDQTYQSAGDLTKAIVDMGTRGGGQQ